jgi:hypothetical protein
MVKKVIFSVLGLAAAIGAPAALYKTSNYWKAAAKPAAPAPAVVGTAGEAGSTGGPLAPAEPPAPSLEGTQVRSLAEVLNFSVTPEWIMRRWPRVSTGLAQLQLQGYRVPLVTGTAESDLAGSLTYYFNPQQQVQRIAFHGTTGDARKLVAMLAAQYHLTRRLTNDPGLMVYEAVRPDGRPASACRIRSASIVQASDAYRRFDVELVLERPQG